MASSGFKGVTRSYYRTLREKLGWGGHMHYRTGHSYQPEDDPDAT